MLRRLLRLLGLVPGQSYTVSVTADDGHGHAVTAGTTLTVNKANPALVINPYSGTYDGEAHGLSASATGALGEDLSSLLNLGPTYTNAGDYAVAQCFLSRDAKARAAEVRVLEEAVRHHNQKVIGWRDVPVDPKALGPIARSTMPVLRQLFIGRM